MFDGQHLQSILTGLEENGITSYTHLLTGYVGSVSLLKMIAEVCRKLREWNPNLMYGTCGGRKGSELDLALNARSSLGSSPCLTPAPGP